MLGRYLESEDFNVVFAASGLEAMGEFLIRPYDLLLLDLMMPGANGWQVFDALGRLHPMMPIILMTALPHQQERAAQIGADALLEKPLDLPLLLLTIRDALSRSAPIRFTRAQAGARQTAPLSPLFTPQLLDV